MTESMGVRRIAAVAEGCVSCGLCLKDCALLRDCGSPGQLCRDFLAGASGASSAVFLCTLCGLCQAVCPKDLECAAAFLDMRRLVQEDARPGRQASSPPCARGHQALRSYEMLGKSPLLSLFQASERGDTVFFPGCALGGTRSAATYATYRHLQSVLPGIGIVLSCCSKPSHDLGLHDLFQHSFAVLIDGLDQIGARTVVTACPSCYVTFAEHAPAIKTISVYEILATSPPAPRLPSPLPVAIHDACTTRSCGALHEAVRTLVRHSGAELQEMEHNRAGAICCGEGGGAACIAPSVGRGWRNMRAAEAGDRRVITYCAGCSSSFAGKVASSHLLDLLFFPELTLQGREKVSRSPFTYLRRLLLKNRLRREAKNTIPA